MCVCQSIKQVRCTINRSNKNLGHQIRVSKLRVPNARSLRWRECYAPVTHSLPSQSNLPPRLYVVRPLNKKIAPNDADRTTMRKNTANGANMIPKETKTPPKEPPLSTWLRTMLGVFNQQQSTKNSLLRSYRPANQYHKNHPQCSPTWSRQSTQIALFLPSQPLQNQSTVF